MDEAGHAFLEPKLEVWHLEAESNCKKNQLHLKISNIIKVKVINVILVITT